MDDDEVMPQILDREVPEWRVFVDVAPVFALGIPGTWTLISQNRHLCTSDPDQVNNTLDKHNVPFRKKLEDLGSYLGKIEKMRPSGILPRDHIASCKTSLSSLLDALEELVDEEVLDNGDGDDDVLQDTATNATYGSILSTVSGLSASMLSYLSPYKSFSTTMRGANPNPPSPLPRVNNSEDEHSTEARYPKLDALGIIFQQRKELNASRLCQEFIRTGYTHEQVDEITQLTRWLYKSFLNANSTAGPPGQVDTHIDETMCHWDYRRPWDTSSQLFYLLSRNAREDGHLVRLQLDGRGLNRREANDYVRFSVFISKCPQLLPSEEWREGEFMSVPRVMKDDEQFYLCDFAISSHSPEVKSILFTPTLLLTPVNPRTSYSPFPDAYPTISLAELLERGVFGHGEHSLFKKEDKAVLSFSIGLCLLHLLYSSWMHQRWTAQLIHFLHKRTRTGAQIFNIHFPYIATSLVQRKPVTTLKLTKDKYGVYLQSFAQLLVEIETGSLFQPQQDESFETQLLDVAKDIETRGNAEYAEAIRGCIELTKPPTKLNTLAQPRSKAASSSRLTFDDLRRRIFQSVVRPLEINYRTSYPAMKKHRHGPFDIPGPPTNAVRRPSSISSNRGGSISDSIFCFDDLVPPTVNALAEARAKTFFDNFSTFRKHFIAPKMTDRRGGRRRLRIAVLDTGIDEGDKWLDEALSEVIESRENQGFRGSRETNPIKKYWPGEDDAVRDEVGHGTWLAYLLLKYAPDADLYIAKVSKSMAFSDTTKVVDAFHWALEEEVDIISMSFGSREHISALETAIIDCKDKAIVFASASNYGLNDPRTYPARDERVICVHALDGLGGLDSINPATEAKANYGTLGLGVRLSWQGKAECRSGTSYATPILAAISATLLDWLHYHSENAQSTLSPAQYTYLKKTARIREIFERHMSEKQGDLLYVAPWILFGSNGLSKINDTVSVGTESTERKYVQEKEVTVIEAIRDKLPILS
ncbi:putative peptidase S8 subtilisin kexin sedolisin [Rosellinia necatrix]|uniref:Putative peptidase S8 subtilisin kexin sedolisin n=1 Tax=Rosellinia necatrix TaxID=77044 RepID=A0A1W2TKB1_ROSNE|nr:putative peptidase S8 subtilisin kexin sedolisin [Rosellinia necatrix]